MSMQLWITINIEFINKYLICEEITLRNIKRLNYSDLIKNDF